MVSSAMQPWFFRLWLTSVQMKTGKTTLDQRIAEAMTLSGASAARLAKVCGISAAAVSKWIKGRTADLRNEHLFRVADECQVDARWLGTGDGVARPPKHTPAPVRVETVNGLPELALRVARKWHALDDPAKTQILMFIETLGAMQSDNHRKWGAEQQRAAKRRLAKET
ncbi:MAG TPA: helix-turn-helix domain-containing protein [Steroidobacteraceae bacterium]|nr:helix-turn-helix domain-containing protein [Steroidobacteraceae bacterium]